MLVFKGTEDPEVSSAEEPAKATSSEKPQGPVWSRKARDYSGQALLRESRAQLAFQGRGNKLAPWLDRVSDQLEGALERVDRAQERADQLKSEVDELRSQLHRLKHQEHWGEDFDPQIFDDAMEMDDDYRRLGRSTLRDGESWL